MAPRPAGMTDEEHTMVLDTLETRRDLEGIELPKSCDEKKEYVSKSPKDDVEEYSGSKVMRK